MTKLNKIIYREKLKIIPDSPFDYNSFDFKIAKNLTGKDIKICIISNDMPTHFSIKKIKDFTNLSDDDKVLPVDFDYSTILSGICSSKCKQITGLAFNADMYYAKSYNYNGETKISSIISAILWSVIKNVDIILVCGKIVDNNDILKDTIIKAYNSNACLFFYDAKNECPLVNCDKNAEFDAFYTEVFNINNLLKFSKKNSYVSSLIDKTFYSTINSSEYCKIPFEVAIGGIVPALAALCIEEKRKNKEKYTPRDIYSRIIDIFK
jgi:hypothetical protein